MRDLNAVRCRRGRWLGFALAALFGCIAGPASASIKTFGDPAGDTFGITFPGLAPVDITGLKTTTTATELIFELTFGTDIFAPSTGFFPAPPAGTNIVRGYIDIDVRPGGRTTGDLDFMSVREGADVRAGLGVDYFISLSSEEFQPGEVDLVDEDLNIVSLLSITYTDRSLRVAVPYADIGTSDGAVFYSVLVGGLPDFFAEGNQFFNDIASNEDQPIAFSSPYQSPPPGGVVPEPAACVIWLSLGVACAPLWRRRGRKSWRTILLPNA